MKQEIIKRFRVFSKEETKIINSLIEDLIKVKNSDEKRKNLAKLALILRKKKESSRFDMAFYIQTKRGMFDNVLNCVHNFGSCGTCACAVGWSAIHGIGKITEEDTWATYEEKTFDPASPNSYDVWQFLFGPQNSNSPMAAARRISFYLMYESVPFSEIGSYIVDLFFRPDWKLIEKISKQSIKKGKQTIK